MVCNLVDEYTLLIHPVVLGTGRRLFKDEGLGASLQLVSSKTTDKGVVMATSIPTWPAPRGRGSGQSTLLHVRHGGTHVIVAELLLVPSGNGQTDYHIQ